MDNKSLIAIELLLNKHNMTMYKSNGEIKSTKVVLGLIKKCWDRAFSKGRIQMIGVIDSNKEHIDAILNGNIEN